MSLGRVMNIRSTTLRFLIHLEPEDQRSCKRSPEICYINQIFNLKKLAFMGPHQPIKIKD